MARYDEVESEHLVKRGLKILGVEESQLDVMRKGAIEKKVLAWLVIRRAMVSSCMNT